MDLLGAYSDGEGGGPSSSSGGSPPPAFSGAAPKFSISVEAAPQVDTTGLVLYDNQAVSAASARQLLDPRARTIMHNVPYEDLMAPVAGPAHPFQKDGLAAGLKNHRAGHVEDTHLHSAIFDEQYNTFHRTGAGEAPSGIGVVSTQRAVEAAGVDGSAAKRRKVDKDELAAKKQALEELRASTDPTVPFSIQRRLPWADKEVKVVELTEEQKEHMAKVNAEKEAAGPRGGKGKEEGDGKTPTSFFHGKAGKDKDYQGRSWLAAPKDKRKESDNCFLPKRWVHTWSGHTKGVNAIRFFPNTGHMLLSAGLDGKVKIWDVFGSGKNMRTYLGHSKGVKDINFTHDGKRFVSVGYDKAIRLWDTETGQVITSIANNKQHFCGVFHPDPSKENVLMAGCADKRIYQYDLDTGDAVQEYNYHLGAVNTVTFIDEGRRFVSSSDDKTLRVWEFGIPVQIKYVADPSMHSIPAITPHPSGNFLCGQSLDNQIVTYSTKDKFKQNRQKTFKGHNTAGYACQVNFSPDAKYVLSGDSEGRAFFWEWRHPGKIVRTIKAHDGVCIGVAWNPMESSKVATCGWDGLIKYWD